MKSFGTLVPALVTLYDEAGEVDPGRTAELARRLVEEGCDGIVVAGTTGESPNLSHEEKLQLFQAVNDAVGSSAFVWAGTGSNSTQASIQLTREAEALGVDGIMLVAPYYNKPSQEGLYRHFGAVAAATSLPVMLYNVPSRTGCNLLPQTVARLARDYSNIRAVKEASGSCDQTSEIRRLAPGGFTIFSGDDSQTLPLLALGAAGVVSVAAHVAAGPMRRLIDAFREGRVKEAEQLHRRLYPLFKAMFLAPSPAPVKAALEFRGVATGGVRLPLVPLNDVEREQLQGVLAEAGVLS